MKSKLPLLGVIVLVSFTVLVICVTFDRCQRRKENVPAPISIQAQIDSVKAHEFKLQPVIDSLNNVNGKLHEKDSLNKKSLAWYQSENKRLAKAANAHIDSMGLYEPPIDDSAAIANAIKDVNDYAGNVKEIIANAAAADSVCNETIKNLDDINLTQTKIITQKDSLYTLLKQSFNASIQEQKRLNAYDLKLQKQSKRRHTANLVLGGIAIVLTGILIAK